MSIFCSRDIAYKNPYGAAETNTSVNFTIRTPSSLKTSKAFFCTISSTGEKTEQEMCEVHEQLQSTDIYEICFKMPSYPCVLWYNFKLETQDAIRYLNNSGKNGIAEVSDKQGAKWQQTVYIAEENTDAQWYGKGVTYHIFIDRFNRTEVPDSSKYDGRRVIHENWNELPIFLPDEKGEVKNNDFFGGSLNGIKEKLPYLSELSVSTIYLSPMFESESNHRYDTGDYLKIDPMIGTEEDFRQLCQEASKFGMRIILDGVFNHTGCNSRYFNRRGNYDEIGAYQSKDSKYYNWYSFEEWPNKYSSWWGIYTLPQVNEQNDEYRNFIFNSENSIVKHWIEQGASGWRLDVADELPDEFILNMANTVKSVKKDAVMIGEVWEDASSKISYDSYRQYIINGSLNGVTNYPLRNAILEFLREGKAECFAEAIETIKENYPPHVFKSLMNHIGTHDTPRILTSLGCTQDFKKSDKEFRAYYFLSSNERYDGATLLKLASFIQFTMPGSPTVYYGDEVGMEGFEDPLNRKTYPWGSQEKELLEWYIKLGKLRKQLKILQEGQLTFEYAKDSLLVYARRLANECILVAINRSEHRARFSIRAKGESMQDLLTGKEYEIIHKTAEITIEPFSCLLLI